MDFVKERINNLNKLKKGIIIAVILSTIMMVGNWATLWMYFSLFLCDIFSLSSWIEILNVLKYGFGIVGLVLTFSPIVILFGILKKWNGLFTYSDLSNNKKVLDKEIEKENFELIDKKITSFLNKKIYISENYLYIEKIDKIFKKGNYDVKIGANKKKSTIILVDNSGEKTREIDIKFDINDKQLIELAKLIKENIIIEVNVKEREKKVKKDFFVNKIFFIIAFLSFIVFFILMNFANIPISNSAYLILKSSSIILGIINAIIIILFSFIKSRNRYFLNNKFKNSDTMIFSILLSLIPIVCYFGILVALEMLIGSI